MAAPAPPAVAAGAPNRLQGLREERGLSLGELGRATGFGGPMLGRWERGQRLPSVRNALRLARFYGVRVEDLGLDDDDA